VGHGNRGRRDGHDLRQLRQRDVSWQARLDRLHRVRIRLSVWTVKPDGSGDHIVLRDAAEPEWSPSGRRILFSSDAGLQIARADGSRVKSLLTLEAFETSQAAEYCCEALALSAPTWSPTGRRVAFAFSWSNDDDQGRQAVYTASRSGRAVRRLYDGYKPAWSPRGNLIAFVTGSDLDVIATSRPNGTQYRALLRDRRLVEVVGTLDFSPDGRKLLYQRAKRGHVLTPDEVVVVDPVRGTRRLLPIRNVTAAVWSPKGNRIAYATTGDQTIRTIQPDGTGVRKLLKLSHDGPDWLAWAAR
jgi:Tol biopolymer transport system component